MNRTESGWRFHVGFMPNGGIFATNIRSRTIQGKSDGPRFASRPRRAQSLRIWRARRRVGRSRQCGVRSARLCQSRTEPSQRRAAGSARIAVDPGAWPRRCSPIRSRSSRRARPRRNRPRRRPRPRRRAGGCQGAAAKPVAQQRRDGHVGKEPADEGAGKRQCQRDDGCDRSDAAQRAKTAAAAAQHHPENLPRRGAGAAAARHHRRLRFRRAAGGVLVQSFLHLRQQGRAGADVGRLVRARGDPAPCARAASATC